MLMYIKTMHGEDKFGYKFNFYRMTAFDWVADNYRSSI